MTTVKIERAFIHLRSHIYLYITGADLEGGVRGVHPPPPLIPKAYVLQR